jgi:hypothetical protein
LERANLKARQPDVYKKLAADYEAWNATMLPEDPEASSGSYGYADTVADRPGVTRK